MYHKSHYCLTDEFPIRTVDYLSGKADYKFYTLLLYVLYWIVPAIIISICYILIIATFKRSSLSLKKVADESEHQHQHLGSSSSSSLVGFHQADLHPVASLDGSTLSKTSRRQLRDSIRLNNFIGSFQNRHLHEFNHQTNLEQRRPVNTDKSKSGCKAKYDSTEPVASVSRSMELNQRAGASLLDTRPASSGRPTIRGPTGSALETQVSRASSFHGSHGKRRLLRRVASGSYIPTRQPPSRSLQHQLESGLNLVELHQTSQTQIPVDANDKSVTLKAQRHDDELVALSKDNNWRIDAGKLVANSRHPRETNADLETRAGKHWSRLLSFGTVRSKTFDELKSRLVATAANLGSNITISSDSRSSGIGLMDFGRGRGGSVKMKNNTTTLSSTTPSSTITFNAIHNANSRLSRTVIQIRLAKMSFYLILLWLVSWTPIASLAMINSVVKCHQTSATAVFLANTMTKLGPAFDVFIYGVSHPKIKNKFKQIIKWLFMIGKKEDRKFTFSKSNNTYQTNKFTVNRSSLGSLMNNNNKFINENRITA